MQIIGLAYIRDLIDSGEGFDAKCVFNRSGAIFFPGHLQHQDQKTPGISYKNNYKGNALAAMVMPGRFEIRFHEKYADADVAEIMAAMAGVEGLEFLANWRTTYQGRRIELSH
ncbi:MAG: hypothetical protein H6819_10140 [Phycisphaerales bacterium]|nr:hypothetical protein [Phycisphaerales bacterium]MCB9856574.1 hypothetical protein [Phycisphaerales bacterium]